MKNYKFIVVKLNLYYCLPQNNTRKATPIECSLNINGSDLKELIAATFDVSKDMLKLICKGRVVQNIKTLQEQDIKVSIFNFWNFKEFVFQKFLLNRVHTSYFMKAPKT